MKDESDNLHLGPKLVYPVVNTTTTSRATVEGEDRKKYALGLVVFVTLFALVLFVAFSVSDESTSHDTAAGGIISFLALVMLVAPIGIYVWVSAVYNRVKYNSTLSDFAKKNNLDLVQKPFSGVIGKVIAAFSNGELESRGEDGSIMKINTMHDGRNVSFGVQTRGSDKRSVYVGRVYSTGPYRGFAHLQIQLRMGAYPHLIIDADANNHNFTATNLTKAFSGKYLYQLEGNFPDYFKVFAVNENMARIAYYILTPDIMALMLDHIPNFDIELDGKQLNLYWDDTALKSELEPDLVSFLPRAYGVLDQVVYKIVERIEKYQAGGDNMAEIHEKMQLRSGFELDLLQARQVTYGYRNELRSSFTATKARIFWVSAGFTLLAWFLLFLVSIGIVFMLEI